MKTFISTSIEAGSPEFARSCLIVHDIDFLLSGDGTSIDADLCVDFATSMSAKDYRYGVLDFQEITDYLSTCTSSQAEECANNFNDAINSLKSAFPSVRWTVMQLGRTNPYESGMAIPKKQLKTFLSENENYQIFANILSSGVSWLCADLRPDENEFYFSSTERHNICKARSSCAISLLSKAGWTENIYGCIGKYVWNPRSSTGYVDGNFPMQAICQQLQYFGIGGLLHYHPGSVVWRVHDENPANDSSNGISNFSDMFTFEDARNSIYNDASNLLSMSAGFGNFGSGNPREILLNKIVDKFKGEGAINQSEHEWHRLNRNVSANGYWLRKEDKPPRPNPSDFS